MRSIWITWACLAMAGAAGAAPIDPLSATTEWTPILFPSSVPDPGSDQGTGDAQGDIVGDSSNAAFYIDFDGADTPSTTDGNLAFRVRLGADTGPSGFSNFLLVGVDGDADGSLDIILGVDFQGNPDSIAVYAAGSGTNTSPSTTSMDATPLSSDPPTSSNYAWTMVDNIIDPGVSNTDIDGQGDTDYFLSFVVPFADIIAGLAADSVTGIDEDSELSFVVGTSKQPNAFNQDIGGTDLGWSETLPWDQLGAISVPTLIRNAPEPGTFTLTALGLATFAAMRSSRRGPRR